MRKTIYLTETNHTKLREALLDKLKDHKDRILIGKSDKNGYEGLAEYIQKSLSSILQAPEYTRLKSLEKYISYHSLWTILYHTKRNPGARKRMNRIVIELLLLFAFGEIKGEMLIEEPWQGIPVRPTKNELYELISEHGFAYYEEFSFRKLQQQINKAKVEIKILDTFLDNWSRLRSYLKKATERNCRVRILVSDPHLQSIVDRSKHIAAFGGTPESLIASISAIQEEISSWEHAGLVELHTHDCLPGFNLFGLDETCYIGIYWHKREAIEGPFMKATNESFKVYVNEHFESLWEYARQRGHRTAVKSEKKLNPKLAAYCGNWYLYCNKVGKNEESFKLRSMDHGKVVENLLQLTAYEGELEAVFVSTGRGIFRGRAYLCPSNGSFLEIWATSDRNKDTLHFIFHVGKGLDNQLIGIYNHMYVRAPILGTGLACIVKVEDDKKFEPEKWKGRKASEITNDDTQKILRFLTFPIGTRIEAIQSFEQLKTLNRFNLPSLFKGVYKIYAYQGSESEANNRFISVSLLKIDHAHQAFHKRCGSDFAQDGRYSYSLGMVQSSKEDSLFINMKDKEHGRLGFFVINIGDYSPRTRHYYTGIFSAVALGSRRIAIGSRVVLEYLGDDYKAFEEEKIDRYSIFSDEYEELPKEVRLNLTGRVNNMIGFLKTNGASSQRALNFEAENGLNLRQIFFDSACQRALADDPNEVNNSAKMFERAILHGFRPFHAFEQKLEEYEGNGLVSSRIKKAILENKLYLDLKKSVNGFY